MTVRLTKATRQHTRDHNSRLVLQTIYDAGQISRADLARHTNLTRTTISDVVSDLMGQGLVEEVGQGPIGVGRTPTLLSVVPNSRLIVTINVTATEIQGAVVNLRGEVRHSAVLRHSMAGNELVAAVIDFAKQLMAAVDGRLLGLGVSAPGLIDMRTGTVVQAVNVGWQDVPLQSMLQQHANLPVYIAHDGHTLAMAEFMFGPHTPSDNLVAIKVGTGVGSGIVLGGQLFAGDEYGAGEIGHMVVEENGLPCRCGNVGCLETVAAIPSIIHRAELLAQRDPNSMLRQFATPDRGITLESVIAAFEAGDQNVHQIVQMIGRSLGIGVATLVVALGIRRIVVTGRVAPFGDVLCSAIAAEVQRRVLPALARNTVIEVAQRGSDQVLVGTAALLLTNELGLTRLVQQSEAVK